MLPYGGNSVLVTKYNKTRNKINEKCRLKRVRKNEIYVYTHIHTCKMIQLTSVYRPENLLFAQNYICCCDIMIIKNRYCPYPLEVYSLEGETDMNQIIVQTLSKFRLQ